MEEGRFPPSFQISRQLDQEKINFLTRRVDELIQSNNDLRTSSGQNEKDTHDIVIYFQREMEIKDDVILKLNEELVKCQTQLKFEVEKVRKTFEEELTEIRSNSESTITSLTEKFEACESELKAVFSFKKAKDQHEGTIARLEKSLQQQREQLIDAMEEQERRFLEEKASLFKDLDEQKAAFREVRTFVVRLVYFKHVSFIIPTRDTFISPPLYSLTFLPRIPLYKMQKGGSERSALHNGRGSQEDPC